MGANDLGNGDAPSEIGRSDFLDLCRRFNEHGVRYLVYGGFACILHGRIRTTCDVDIFLGDDADNIKTALRVLAGWGEGYARELSVEDVTANAVVRIVDRFTVDLASRVWKLNWSDAWRSRRIVTLDSVDVPVVSRAHLLLSKDTPREQDALDRLFLSGLTSPEPGRPAVRRGERPVEH